MNSKINFEIESLRLNLNTFTEFDIKTEDSFPSFLEAFQTNTNLKKLKLTGDLLLPEHFDQMIKFLELLKNNKTLKTLQMILAVGNNFDNKFSEKLLETLKYNKTLKRFWFFFHLRNQKVVSLILELLKLKTPSIALCMIGFTKVDFPIFQKLREIKYLRKLILRNVDRSLCNDDFFESLKYIEKLELNLINKEEDDDYYDSIITRLSESLKQTKVLRVLKLSLDTLGDDAISDLSDALKINTTIEELFIHFDYVLMNIDFEGLLRENTKLKKLFLHAEDSLEDPDYDNSECLIRLFRGLKHNKTLREISCPVYELDDFRELREALQVNDTLKKLTIEVPTIYLEGFSEIKQILRLNKALTHFAMIINVFSEDCKASMNKLLPVLKENKNLTCFKFITSCPFFEENYVHRLIEVIRENKTLRALSITLNEISDSDVVSLLGALKENKTLKKFELYSMTIKVNEELTYAIANLLKTNKTLTQLGLFVRKKPKETKISETLAKTIKDGLRANKNISKFYIDIPRDTLQEMQFIVRKNQLRIKHREINISDFESISDVTLYFNQKNLRLHRVILSQSEVFKNMFQENPDKKEFQIQETDEHIFLEMIQYLYGSEVKKSEELSEMLKKYRVPEKQFDLGAMFNNPLFSDVSFKLKDHLIHLHKIVLCSQSDYMKAMLLGSFMESKKSQVEINEENPDSFMVFLESFYKDQVEKNVDKLLELLILSDKYLFYELKNYLQVLLDEKLQIKNVCEVLDVSDTYNAPILKKSCLRYISQNLNRVKQTRGYRGLKEELKKLLNEEKNIEE
jgi:hypothetical protein